MEQEVKVVRSGPALMIGYVDGENCLRKPRMIFANQAEATMNLAPLIGSPDRVIIDRPDFQYICKDEELLKFYRQETSDIPGLQIVK